MNWDDLRILLSVARHGLIATAARETGLDPTTVSRRIERLERATGQVLVERQRAGPRLTEAGRRMVARAAAIEHASAGLDEGRDARAVVRISTSEGFGTWFVAHHLHEFARANPALHIDLVAGSGFLNPSKRETDVSILLARPRRGPLVTRKLSTYALRLYAARGYDQQVTRADDLRAHPLVGYIPDHIYAPELDYLDEVATGLVATLRSSSINAQYRMIAAGAGIGVLPCFIGDADTGLVPVLPDIAIRRAFWLSAHRDTRRLAHVDRFVTWLVGLIAQHQGKLAGDGYARSVPQTTGSQGSAGGRTGGKPP